MHAEKSICKADKLDCLHYQLMRRKDGTYAGVCKLRYDAKKNKKKQEADDIKNTQDLSTYTGRRV